MDVQNGLLFIVNRLSNVYMSRCRSDLNSKTKPLPPWYYELSFLPGPELSLAQLTTNAWSIDLSLTTMLINHVYVHPSPFAVELKPRLPAGFPWRRRPWLARCTTAAATTTGPTAGTAAASTISRQVTSSRAPCTSGQNLRR